VTVLDSFRLDGRVALVTGASRGLGQGMAIALAEAGADVAALDVLGVEETGERVNAVGRRCHAITADLSTTTPQAARAVVAECVEALGRLDVLVNNAGIIRRAPALEYGQEDWDPVIAINLTSAFYFAQAAAQRFVEQREGGKIINTASVLSFDGGILVPAYTATKHAVAGLTRALANEWAGEGINVNAIAPSYFETEVTAALRSDPQRSEALLARLPAGRFGTAEDLAGPVVLLASDASRYMHGSIVAVDGGWLAF
jgi:2-dehydro-3-deoxy-D-gluconate 5-dehydrogenase